MKIFSLIQQKRRERGRIDVRGIKLVEPAILHGEGGDVHAPNVISIYKINY
jgi:tyrosine-protein kinase Tec